MYNISNLTKLKQLDENASDAMQAFWSFDKAAFALGAIDVLQKQLIAVAVALTTQCPYCIDLHLKAARHAGRRTRCWPRRQLSQLPCEPELLSRTRRICSAFDECNGPKYSALF